MKKIAVLLLAILMVFSVVGCSSSESTDKKDIKVVSKVKGTVRLAFAGWQLNDGIDPITGEKNIGVKSFIKNEFQPRFPNIKIQVYQIPWQNAQAKQTAMLKSGDVDVMYTAGAYAAQWNQQGLLKNINELMAKDKSFDSSIYLQGVMNNSYSTKSPDKKVQFGIPSVLGQYETIYDNTIFKEWGVEPLSEAATPAEILEKAKKMTGKNPKTGKQNYGLWWDGASLNATTFVALTSAFKATGGTGTIDHPKNIKWNLNSPEMVKVMQWLKDASKYTPDAFVNSKGVENFGQEKNNNVAIGLDMNGSGIMGLVKGGASTDLLKRYKPAMNIGENGRGWVAVDPFVMAKKAKNEEASWQVMKFFTSYTAQKFAYKNFGYTPTLSNPDFLDSKDQYTKTALKLAAISKTSLLDEANPFFSSQIIPAVNGFISKAHDGNAPDIKTFLNDLQKSAVKWSAQQ
jgi:ABC-type glycerol-3-phosphate transport system substrate-binding protein